MASLIRALSISPTVTRFRAALGPDQQTQVFALALARAEDLATPYNENAKYNNSRVVLRGVDDASRGEVERVLVRPDTRKGPERIFEHALNFVAGRVPLFATGRTPMSDVNFVISEKKHLVMEIFQPPGEDFDVSFISAAMSAAIFNARALKLIRILIPPLGLPHLDLAAAAHTQIWSLSEYWSPYDDYPKEIVIAIPDEATYETYLAKVMEMYSDGPRDIGVHLRMVSQTPKMADTATIEAIVSHIQQHPAENHTEAISALNKLTRHPSDLIAEKAREAIATITK